MVENITVKRCWEFFRCRAEDQKKCLMPDVENSRCWLVNINCCKMDINTPNPLAVKKNFCKNCEYYKEYNKTVSGKNI